MSGWFIKVEKHDSACNTSVSALYVVSIAAAEEALAAVEARYDLTPDYFIETFGEISDTLLDGMGIRSGDVRPIMFER